MKRKNNLAIISKLSITTITKLLPLLLMILLSIFTTNLMAEIKSVSNTLSSGQQLNLNQYIESSNKVYRFYLQGDGNLVFRNMQTNVSIWSSATNGTGGIKLVMQGDGNLVLRKSNNSAVWASGTVASGITPKLIINDNGTLQLYHNSTVKWQKGTGTTPTTYTLTVNSGTGAGNYVSGASVSILANAAPSGKVFDKWVSNSGNPTIVNINATSTTLKMPANTASVTATYKNLPSQTYTLTVNNGNGDGSYISGATVNISANAAPSGHIFDKWVKNSGNPIIANENSVNTTLTMPANAANVMATYKAVAANIKNIGSVTGFAWHARKKVTSPFAGSTIYNLPMFQPENDQDFWDNLVEEYAHSGLDYMAVNVRGYIPNNNWDVGDPRRLADLMAAMDRRGLSDAFKIAFFDDNPASWQRARSITLGLGNDAKFNCGDTTNYKYIWDRNIKTALTKVPSNRWHKIDGRPLLIFWHAGDSWFTNQGNGNLKKIMLYIRKQCQLSFGVNPYIIVADSFVDKDPQISDPAVIDGVHDWFNMSRSHTVRTFNGTKVGALVPGFSKSESGGMFLDPKHGQTLTDGLQATVNGGCKTTFIEGFTDFAENAALHRSEGGYAATYYDYPNQRINIVRKFTGKDFVRDLKLEAEACDSYYDKSSGNSGKLYRNGNLDIVRTNDVNGGWNVTNTQAGEWLEWKEIPLSKATFFSIRYRSTAAATINFSVDGTSLGNKVIASTNGNWATIENVASYSNSTNGYHSLKVNIVAGTPEINFFTVKVSGSKEDLAAIETETTAADYILNQNYPNPFNPATTISFALPVSENVKLSVMNAKGETVKELANGSYQPGSHSFNFDASGLNSGIYFYQLVTSQKIITKKMIMIK